ncbi:MAG: hypothetical protein Q9221_003450 [Calogaya cf. arnoldii]
MRLPRWITVASISPFLPYTLAHGFSLSMLQPISGFSNACTQAYNTPLTDCTLSDFYEGNTCSSGCVNFLKDLTARLNDECEGITALPNTLIGMFFERTALQELCTGTQDTTDPADDEGSKDSATVESTSATSSRSSSRTTSTIVETATRTATSTTSTPISSTTTTIQTPVVPSNTANAGQVPGGGPPTATAGGSSTSGPSDTQGDAASADPNNSSGGGGNNDGTGGTVLEAATATGNVKSIHGLLSFSACLALVMWNL